MAGPFIFIATNRLRLEKLEDERARVPGLVDFIEANEPRLIAFNEYASEDGTEVAVVQVHPDADSMTSHMELVAERAARAYAETVEATGSSRCCDGRPAPACRSASSLTTWAASCADVCQAHAGDHPCVNRRARA
jgi:hypothetical protein